MNMRTITLLTLFVTTLFLPTPRVYAQKHSRYQPGYVVTVAGDTIRGLLHIPRLVTSEGVLFRADVHTTEQKYTTQTIKAFGLNDGQRFVKRMVITGRNSTTGQLDSSAVFLHQLIDGYARFYRYDDDPAQHINQRFIPNQIQYFISKGGDRLISLREPYQTTLAAIFQDCSTLPVPGFTINERKIGSMVLLYDTLCHPQSVTHDYRPSVSLSTLQLHIGLKANAQSGTLFYDDFGYLPKQQVRNHILPAYSLELRLAYSGPWSLVSGVQYTHHRGTYINTKPAQAGTSNADKILELPASVEVKSFLVPIILRYTWGHKSVRPYLAAGILNGFYFDNNTTLPSTIFTSVGENGTTLFREDVMINKAPQFNKSHRVFGNTLRIGFQLKNKTRFWPGFEMQYNSGRDFENNPGILYGNNFLERIGRLHYRNLGISTSIEF